MVAVLGVYEDNRRISELYRLGIAKVNLELWYCVMTRAVDKSIKINVHNNDIKVKILDLDTRSIRVLTGLEFVNSFKSLEFLQLVITSNVYYVGVFSQLLVILLKYIDMFDGVREDFAMSKAQNAFFWNICRLCNSNLEYKVGRKYLHLWSEKVKPIKLFLVGDKVGLERDLVKYKLLYS